MIHLHDYRYYVAISSSKYGRGWQNPFPGSLINRKAQQTIIPFIKYYLTQPGVIMSLPVTVNGPGNHIKTLSLFD